MDKKRFIRHEKKNSVSFLGEHNILILRKSLQHLRKPQFDEKPDFSNQLRRNNSLNSKQLPNVPPTMVKVVPSHSPSIMMGLVRGSSNENMEKKLLNSNFMTTSNISRMMNSLSNFPDKTMNFPDKPTNFQEKSIRIKMKGVENPSFFTSKQKSPTSALHLAQMKRQKTVNNTAFPFKTTGRLIKILSSDKLKTPKKEERSSWNSKQEKMNSSNVQKVEVKQSFFLIKNRNISRFNEENKSKDNSLGLVEGESIIISPENHENFVNSINKEKSQILPPKANQEAHKKINDMLTSIVEKASIDEENIRLNPLKKISTENKIEREYLLTVENTRVLTCRFNQEDNLLAIGGEDGITRIMTPNKKSVLRSLSDNFCFNNPANNVRWKPKDLNSILLVTNINGAITHWDITKKKFLNQIIESQNIFATDYNINGEKFAVAGTDTTVKIYESQRFQCLNSFQGHANRVYALKFHNTIPELLLSGGWDETMLLWDLRVPQKENPISYLYGPLICGEAIDIKDNYILTGSWRDNQQIELWDMRKLQILKKINWVYEKPEEKSYIYSVQFSKFTDNYIIAGSSGLSEIRIFQCKNDETFDYECVEKIQDLKRSIYTLDFCHETNTFVFGDGEGHVGIVDILL